MERDGKSNEYNEFWIKFVKNAEEILKEYNKLSPDNKQRASMEAQRIIMSQGILGIWDYVKTLR